MKGILKGKEGTVWAIWVAGTIGIRYDGKNTTEASILFLMAGDFIYCGIALILLKYKSIMAKPPCYLADSFDEQVIVQLCSC